VLRGEMSRSGLFVHLRGMNIEAAICMNGIWLIDSIVTLPVVSIGRASDLPSWDHLASALESLAQKIQPQVPKLSADQRVMHVAVAHDWMGQAFLPWAEESSRGLNEQSLRQELSMQSLVVNEFDVICVESAGWQESRWAVIYRHRMLELLRFCANSLQLELKTVLPEASVISMLAGKNQESAGVFGYVSEQTLSLVEARASQVTMVLQRPLHSQPGIAEISKVWQSIRLRSPHLQNSKLILLTDSSEPTDLLTGIEKTQSWPLPTDQGVSGMLRALHYSNSPLSDLNAVTIDYRGIRWTAIFVILFLSILISGLGAKWWFDKQKLANLREKTPATQQVLTVSKTANALTKAQQDQLTASNAAIRQLNLPVAQLLTALRPPKDIRVALLGVDMSDSGSNLTLPSMRVNAEALSGEDAARYVAFLSDRRPFVSAHMVRHEVQQNTPERVWRFTVEVIWQP
jgi:hypothetical protein